MGTKVHSKSCLPGYYWMRDLNEDSSSSSWPLCYGDKAINNGQYCNGFAAKTIMDGYPGYSKDALKQKMLEHEAVFNNQVYELHRLYRIQRDLMEEAKRKELNRIRASMEPSSSSSLRGSQVPSEDARKWHMAGFPLLNSGYERTSVSGVEIVNSPMSCTKGNNMQLGEIPFQNGLSLKDSELLDSRPLKVRKKLFDLELPADEDVDTEDDKRSPVCKVSDVSSYARNGNKKGGHESRVAQSALASRSRNSIGLADLNEPVEIEEAMGASSSNFIGHSSINGETKGLSPPAKQNAGYLVVNEEKKLRHDGFLINSSMESKVNERERHSQIYGAGSSKGYVGLHQEKLFMPSQYPVQGMLNRKDHLPGIFPTGLGKEDQWREKTHHGLESSYGGRNLHSVNGHLEQFLASEAPHSDPFFSSCFSGAWAHSVSPWAKPTSSFTQKITLEPRNGFYHGSASGHNELKAHLPSCSTDYLNHSRRDSVTSNHTTNRGFGHFLKGPCLAGSKPSIDINLNEVVILQDDNVIDEKGNPGECLSALPWLKNKPATNASSDMLSCKAETVTDLNQPFNPPKVVLVSSEDDTEIAENQNVKKILGFPIFKTGASRNEPSSHLSTSASFGCPPNRINDNKERKNIVIDINIVCEPEELIVVEEQTVDKEKQTKGASVRDFIDLNSCVTDCEDVFPPSQKSETANVKTVLEIDLESPFPLEKTDADTPPKENIVETETLSPQDEVLRDAAETILSISSCPVTISDSLEASLGESLRLFLDAVSSYADELKSPSGYKDGSAKDLLDEMDDFVSMTLQLPETKEEDYMPMPFVPEVLKAENAGANSLPVRPRRGQSRRGRQRRDFQRDILPGLASLSRHEVTEDIQTFAGLMRATGHHWTSGLTRRNGTRSGGGRGRRRAAVVETISTATPTPVCTPLMQQLNSIEGGLEDRSLTGWGKTTRRPRRQRCPAANNPAVVIT